MAVNETSAMEYYLSFLFPPPCYDTIFVEHNFFDGPCLKKFISKSLGYAIVCLSFIVKVPQIMKILQAGNAKGLSIVSVTLELVACTASFAYSFSKGYPFSTYGDAGSLDIQTWIIAYLILSYNYSNVAALGYSLVVGAVTAFLLSPSAPSGLLWGLQASVMPIIATARLIQAYQNYANKSTGQLSGVTYTMLLGGNLARIFTSVQETGDAVIIATYFTAMLTCAIIFGQILYYGSGSHSKKKVN